MERIEADRRKIGFDKYLRKCVGTKKTGGCGIYYKTIARRSKVCMECRQKAGRRGEAKVIIIKNKG